MSSYTEFSMIEHEKMMLRNNRVGLLGGTFNPVHNGHISMAKIALYEYSLGEVVFLPLGLPPHKRDEYIAPPDVRLDMLKLAIQSEARFSVDPIELYREGFTYTVDTLEFLNREHKNTDYYFIIGADTLFELKTWRKFERVFLLTSFICVLRPGQDDDEVKRYADELNDIYGYRFYIAKEKGPDVSSSYLRELAGSGMSVRGLVPDKVADYIEKNNVYNKGNK